MWILTTIMGSLLFINNLYHIRILTPNSELIGEDAFNSLIVESIISVLLVAALTDIVIKSYTERLQANVQQVKDIIKGKHDKEVFQRGTDEIGELSKHVNDVSRQIREYASEVSKKQEIIDKQNRYHPLTGLPNRKHLTDYLKEMEEEYIDTFAVLYVKLNRFKIIYDMKGQETGDKVLKEISARISASIPNQVFLSHVEKDEFVILLEGEKNVQEVSHLAQGVMESIKKSLSIGENVFYIHSFIGVSIYPFDHHNFDDLINYAGMAMNEAKKVNGYPISFYHSNLQQKTAYELQIEHRLQEALKHDKLHVLYQPKYSTFDEQIMGAEALVRWHDEEIGTVSPATFIPIAERIGVIEDLTQKVLNNACRDLKELSNLGSIPISINVSPTQFLKKGSIIKMLKSTFNEYQVSPSQFEIEVTESAILTDETQSELEDIKDLGVSVAIDDFGTGYSSLNYLNHLPIDTLKIDRSFIQNIYNYKGNSLTELVINLGEILNMKIVAEGVETEEQMKYLVRKNCDEIQGFLLSAPITLYELKTMIEHPYIEESTIKHM